MDNHYDANNYLKTYEEFKDSLLGVELPWIKQQRTKAFKQLQDKGFPTQTQEDWRYTNLKHMSTEHFSLAKSSHAENLVLSAYGIPDNTPTVVFVDGMFSSEHSSLDNIKNTIYIAPLEKALEDKTTLVKKALESHREETSSLHALNTLFLRDGIVVIVPDNTQLENPLYCLFITTQASQAALVPLRNIVYLGKNSQATFVEHYVSLDKSHHLSSVKTHVELHNHAVLHHVNIQEESDKAYHLGETQVFQQNSSSYNQFKIDMGGLLVRNTHETFLQEKEANCNLLGFYLGKGRQLVDNHTTIIHEAPHTESSEYYKGILSEKSQGIFNGKIYVKPHAIKTNAKQSNKNLLLSTDAEVNTKPQLEIYTDDVQCAHGATVTTLDKESLFYLRSRGISEEKAKQLVTLAFVQDILNFLPQDSLGKGIEKHVKTHFQEEEFQEVAL